MEPGLGFAACILAKWLASNDDPSKGVKSPGCLSDPLQACSCHVNQSETLNWLPPARRSRRVIVIAFRPDPEHVEGTTTPFRSNDSPSTKGPTYQTSTPMILTTIKSRRQTFHPSLFGDRSTLFLEY